MLETVILQAGHEVLFYPKFHCELNYIEYYWAALKRYTREHILREKIVLILKQMAFEDRSKRWPMAYINELTEEQRACAEKENKSNRHTKYCMKYHSDFPFVVRAATNHPPIIQKLSTFNR